MEEGEERKSEKSPTSMPTVLTTVLVMLFIVQFAVIIVLAMRINEKDNKNAEVIDPASSFPCPPEGGGLMTSGEPREPGPFHDVTSKELERVYSFLMSLSDLNLTHPVNITIGSSSLFLVDLWVPAKEEVVAYLDRDGPQPEREALAMVFRGDLTPPVVEEYRVGPLNNVSYARLVNNTKRRNPVSFSVRPTSDLEEEVIAEVILPYIDSQISPILIESYGGNFTDCGDRCLTYNFGNLGTALLGDLVRKQWLWAAFDVEYYGLTTLDIAFLITVDSPDPQQWTVDLVRYSGATFQSLQDLADRYHNNTINKTRLAFVGDSTDLPISMRMRGDPVPETPRRPPVQVEPDGKRYEIRHRHVTYMQWAFDFRMSPFHGPQLYDIKFLAERIAYEVGLSEIAVFHSGGNLVQRYLDFMEGWDSLGLKSRTLIPGTDCPESASYIAVTFLSEGRARPETVARAFCLFEHNSGVPLRRHMSWSWVEGNVYGGMADSYLVLRSVLAVYNINYVVDFLFHQNGALEVRILTTGYIMASFPGPSAPAYGFQVGENIVGNLHQHLFHLKVDVDVMGTANRYETLNLAAENVEPYQFGNDSKAGIPYSQVRMTRKLVSSEKEALHNFRFELPQYHIIHHVNSTSPQGNARAYRLQMTGMSKQLLPENVGNEGTVPWARQQLAVTVRKEDERFSSSPYAMFDSLQPVVNFSQFYLDDDSLVDEDLVFWVTLGAHHIPHSEDVPLTATVGQYLSLLLQPFNYFPYCPSMASRDSLRVEGTAYESPYEIRVVRNGSSANDQCDMKTVEDFVRDNPHSVLQTSE